VTGGYQQKVRVRVVLILLVQHCEREGRNLLQLESSVELRASPLVRGTGCLKFFHAAVCAIRLDKPCVLHEQTRMPEEVPGCGGRQVAR
jgi:hypothetical protein